MVEKKEGKENEKCSTMPDVLIKGYKMLMRLILFDSLRFLPALY